MVCHAIALFIEFKILNKNINLKLNKTKFVLKPFIASLAMAVSSYVMYILIINKIQNKLATLFSIGLGMLIYVIFVILLKIFSKEEIFMIPFGKKVYYFLENLKLYRNG